eukprot:CAMPEP_0184321808 /NCGR_PEP_ID=MMETSP1049-20130417/121191_1 /TAXON_ID=77928 /ORGANISM="Proteomonas sulcata, Strain CCMP704" /LENGTH=249 /DNA_ID=CAMNT_0026642755 /DNA_START=69 /DNA_END=818 /DNA_ORIENTATION=-
MEDVHIVRRTEGLHIFAVCDGHGGDRCAKYLEAHLAEKIATRIRGFPDNIPEALTRVCEDVDKEFLNSLGGRHEEQNVGSCAVIVVLKGNRAFCANVGDSRAVLYCRDKSSRSTVVTPLSTDHKPMPNTAELQRLKDIGTMVHMGRLEGRIAVSRAFGDATFKTRNVGLISEPEIQTIDLPDRAGKDVFLVIACDGLWDVTTNEQAGDLVTDLRKLSESAKALTDFGLGNGSTDNITAMVVSLNSPFKY